MWFLPRCLSISADCFVFHDSAGHVHIWKVFLSRSVQLQLLQLYLQRRVLGKLQRQNSVFWVYNLIRWLLASKQHRVLTDTFVKNTPNNGNSDLRVRARWYHLVAWYKERAICFYRVCNTECECLSGMNWIQFNSSYKQTLTHTGTHSIKCVDVRTYPVFVNCANWVLSSVALH